MKLQKLRHTLKINNQHIITAISLCLCLMLMLFVHIIDCKIEKNSNLQIVTINTKRIVSDFTNSLSQNTHLSDDQKIMLIKQFDTNYPTLIKNYANHNNVLIIDNGVAIQTPNSIKNITPLIEKQIQIMGLQALKRK